LKVWLENKNLRRPLFPVVLLSTEKKLWAEIWKKLNWGKKSGEKRKIPLERSWEELQPTIFGRKSRLVERIHTHRNEPLQAK
jgi:ribonuclease HI